ncbi:shikimate dehydrogenase [Acholeplasma equirhinis]|uniref:shikimate dehydrogenase n=1 Tax=Acholeplasma equirhinis TaxID=555393 RepID=UPI00197A8532|nr:shikimate dehydrogenase [Acholeplasma equirhinis]MBN3490830.1 shikimate dehydrogenase [Acholeplasma equirhinis]
MKRFGLIGYPVSHSKSPIIHEVIKNYYQLPLSFSLMPIKVEGIKKVLDDIKSGKLDGVNVTIPHKETVIPLLDLLTDKAKKIGAVNTIYLKDSKLVGDNTDYDGFLGLLERSKIDLKDKRVIILGTGGAAKACYHVFKDLGIEPKVVSRTKRSDANFGDVITYDMLKPKDYDIIVNSTPVGMYPNVDESPLDQSLVKDKIVFDLIYNPSETKLMKDAKVAFNGLDMLIIQAVKAESIWHQKNLSVSDELIELMRGNLI